MSGPSSAPLTFLFSDIEGSTQLWERVPQQMQSALTCHDAIARKAVEEHGGRLVRTMGDGIYAVFDDPAGAVGAALQLQRALSDGTNTCGLELRVRCGLHRGQAEHRDGDHYGPAVNRAARIMAIGHGGQTLISEAVAQRLEGRLAPEVSVLDLGRVRLRDLTGPERVYQLCHPRLRADFPPLRSLESTPNNLAQQLNSFVGRERELAEVREALAKSRLLTLLGMGGIGKSRLSVQLGAEVLDDYPDGVWLVELAPLTDPQGVAQAVASVFGVKEEPGQTVVQSLARYLRDKRLLLILDNCEHLVRACAELAKPMLQAAAGLRVLASSRTPLMIAGETTYPVPTLAVPSATGTAVPGDLLRHEAVRLFVDRALAVQPEFAWDRPGVAAAVVDICRRLDGIPLAIELAAARTRGLSVKAIAERLDDRFRLLVTRDETVLPRQRTLRALIDWSHDLLRPEEQVLFRRLAVFSGGWTLEAAEAVGAGDPLSPIDVLDLLLRLVEVSLVAVDLAGERYRMLDTVRHYALERLDAIAADAQATRERHLRFYLALAETAHSHLSGPDQAAWLARLDTERENCLAGHAWSEGQAQSGEWGLRMALALRPYWIYRGLLSLGQSLTVQVLSRTGLQQRDDARLRALGGAGMMCNYLGEYAQARLYFEESLLIAQDIGKPQWAAQMLRQLGAACVGLRDTEAASAYLEEGVRQARELGDQRGLAAAITALAMLHRTQGRSAQALPLYETALVVFRGLGDRLSIAATLLNLTMVSIDHHSLHSPHDMLAEVLRIAEETQSLPMAQGSMDVCAGLAAAHGAWVQAAGFYGTAQLMAEQMGLRRDAADEAFIRPHIERTRQELGASAFDAAESAGRGVAFEQARTQALHWLNRVPNPWRPPQQA